MVRRIELDELYERAGDYSRHSRNSMPSVWTLTQPWRHHGFQEGAANVVSISSVACTPGNTS
jgi:hypothetical protein